ncbi:hypothetical protein B0H67DRAFT_648547 [Lasiosphaeris hirsuta]|uniref:Rhodopsin domain-containing protein n=1 Tax=Lasiosphaeris hirsuta TaxID=260670 RepID=A0AA40A3G5_9PEZI|nr:hypothetical protein B0H67DRAFT_648547 [Lasiosphaeris hirsuta]
MAGRVVQMVHGRGACTFASYGMLLSGITTTPKMISLSQAVNVIMLSILAIPIFGLAMIVIKISATLSLLRVKHSRPWKLCHPLSDWWDITNSTPHCVDANTIHILSIAGSVIGIATDVLLSLSPITFLWTLHRPVRERVLVCLLMGMCLFASVASIVKLVIVLKWDPKPGDDIWAVSMSISTWRVTELFFGIMAGCLPILKPPLERCLGRFGIALGQYQEEELYTDGPRGRNFMVKPIPISFSGKQMDGRLEGSGLSITKTGSEGG